MTGIWYGLHFAAAYPLAMGVEEFDINLRALYDKQQASEGGGSVQGHKARRSSVGL